MSLSSWLGRTDRQRGRGRGRRVRNSARLRKLEATAAYARGRSTRDQPRVSQRSLARLASAPEARLAVALLVVIAIVAGVIASPALLERLEQHRADADRPTQLEAIAVLGHHHLQPSEVAAATGLAKASTLATIEVEQIEAWLRVHPWIRDARALKLPTGQLLVMIDERTPVAVLHAPVGHDSVPLDRLVDADGTPFVEADAEEANGLPRLRSDRVIETGSSDPILAQAVGMRDWLALTRPDSLPAHARSAMHLPRAGSDDGWVLELEQPHRRVLLGEEDLDARMQQLALLLDAAPFPDPAANVIDLRFAGRAVLRSESAVD